MRFNLWPSRKWLFQALERHLYCRCQVPALDGQEPVCQQCGGVVRETLEEAP